MDDRLLAQLRERAERNGALTTDDLRAVLPIETMSADELAMVVLRLEDVGVSVDVSDDLMGSSRRRTPTSSQTPVFQLPGSQAPTRGASQHAAAPGVAPDSYASQQPVHAPASSIGAWKFVAVAGAIVAIGAAALLFFLR